VTDQAAIIDSRENLSSYALLGMSSDDLSKAGLSPNYDVPWKELLQQLVKFLLCEQVSVETWDNREIAIIKSKGGVIGLVSSVEKSWDDRQNVGIITPEHLGYNKEWNTPWTLQASAKPVQKGDLVCFLQGASKPTIIRPHKDHFVVIMIAATPPEAIGMECVGPPEFSRLITDFPHKFLLVWDWEQSHEKPRDREGYKTLLEAHGQVQEHSKTELDTATRLWNAALILKDLGEYELAKERLQEAIEGYKRALRKGHSHTLTAMEALALVYKETEQWKEGEQLFLQVIQIKERMQGADNPDTLSSMASLMLAYQD
jgi:tetratricopeptide (TPR) repeat protein